MVLGAGPYATAMVLAGAPTASADALFLLPGGRPRRFALISDIQAGGRPRRFPRPRARRSRLRIASSICTRSSFNSERIFATSIVQALRPAPKNRHLRKLKY